MNEIRKIWIGQSIKNDSMSWEIGQSVRLNKEGTEYGVIDSIHRTDDGYDINVKQDNLIRAWKSTNMKCTVEYNLIF